ncbi:hypothetical protein ACTFIR_001950 [Dictyostelium discoideum]
MELTEDQEAQDVINKIFENEEENRLFEENINKQKKETPRLASIKKRQTMSPFQNPDSPATPETVKRKRSHSSPEPIKSQEAATPYKTPNRISKEESDLMEAALRDRLPKALQDVLPMISFV